MRPTTTLCTLLVPTLMATAQTMVLAPVPTSVAELNAAFEGTVKFKADDRGRLTADHFDASGRFRQDVMLVEFLDPASVGWSAEENAIVVKCGTGEPQCIDKEIFKLGSIKHTGRSNMAISGGEAARDRAIAALRQVIVDEQERIAALDRATNRRPERKK